MAHLAHRRKHVSVALGVRPRAQQHAVRRARRCHLAGRWARALVFALGLLVAGWITPAWAQGGMPGEELGSPRSSSSREEPNHLRADLQPTGSATVPQGSPAREGQQVDLVQVVGNVRVESESVLHRVKTRAGHPLDLKQVSKDIHAVFGLGYFRDVQVDATTTAQGKLVVSFIVDEKPAIAEIIYEGNDELSVEDISKVVDLKRYAILDIGKVKRNAEKIRELYAEKGYYLAEVDYRITPESAQRNMASVTFEIREFIKVEVKQITFLGNKNLSDEDLLGVMATRPGGFLSFLSEMGTFREKEFEIDLQRLVILYYNHGFVEVSVQRPSIRLSRDKRYLYMTIAIEEGPQYSVGELGVSGDMLSDQSDLMGRLKLGEGDIFNYGQMRQDIEALGELYKNAGYAYVNITPLTRMNPATRLVDLTLDIKQGSKVYFGRIEIAGNQKTRDQVIRRELKIQEGDLFSSAKLRASENEVLRLGFFDKVSIKTHPGARPDMINATVEVEEARTGTFQVGAGFSSTESFIANAQITQANLFGRGQSLSLQAQLSSIRTLFNIQFTEPWLLGTRWSSSVNLYNFEYAYQDFTRRSTGGDLTLGYPITDLIELPIPGDLLAALTYKLEDVDVIAGGRSGTAAGADSNPLFRGGLTSSVRGGLYYDNRNNRRFPTDGQYHSARVEFADRTLTLSENEFLKFDFETRWYFPLFWDFVLRLQSDLGYVMNLDPRADVPLFERYFVGGPTTVRGFERFTLGPVRQVAGRGSDPGAALDAFRIGGNKRLTLTAEVEFPIFTAAGVKGVVFGDMGNAFDNDQSFSLVPDLFADADNDYDDALRTAVGFGVRWLSPIAPLRFEWGFPLRRLRGEKPMVFEFSIANAF